MIVQWCIKGLSLPSDAAAKNIIDSREGLLSNWWRARGTIAQNQIPTKLTLANLDLHVNHFDDPDPATRKPFSVESPFISLACGTVERDAAARTNYVHTALNTALWFGTNFGAKHLAYLFTCWVLVGTRQSVEVESVAEEVRDLNTYRRYSAYQTEGEVTAKVAVPASQIEQCERWRWDRSGMTFAKEWVYPNPLFVRPEILSNVRELI